MKRTLISALITALLVANTISVQAATSDNSNTDSTSVTTNTSTTKVSLDNIKEIMLENNLDMKSAYNSMKIDNQTYKEQREIVDSLTDKEKKTTTGVAAVVKLDTYRTTIKTDNAEYDQKVAKYIYNAQSNFVSYLTAISRSRLEENTVKMKERNALTAKFEYDQGFLSKIEYNKSLQDITTETNTLSQYRNLEELAKSNLCIALGISSDENVTFDTDIKNDLEKVSQINYENDLEKVLDNNYSVQLANMNIDDWKDAEDDGDNNDGSYGEDIYKYKLNNYNIALKQAINNVTSDFRTQYNNLMNSYNTMKSTYDSLNTQQNDYAVTQIQYNFGFVSKNDLEDVKTGTSGLDKVNSDYENAKNTFYANYLRYLQMKEGY